ncbi:Sulfate anion transporter 1 [Bagarius yarrelli]|uniref:Sulfate anion transporter 1 n=1 Tax=Bagarius yarrelli TaxID=175774 RepID=A0A556V6P8_BAGYA|nr:Sulfate anion transporter 1 [Bagarius yarrelli]
MEDVVPQCTYHLERKIHRKTGPVEEIKAKVRRQLSCSLPKVKRTLTDFFPVVKWLPKYKIKEYVCGDVMSGLIVGIILVPQAIAYCLLAGLEPVYGLYTSFFANIIYFFLGTSRHVSVGIFSLMSLMVGQVVDREVYLAGFDLSEDSKHKSLDAGWNGTEAHQGTAFNLTMVSFNIECGKECYAISIATVLTFLAGLYQVLMAVFRLGFVSVYLSTPMLDGFATGASCTILTVQAKYLAGLKIPRHQGYGTVVVTWINIFKNIHKANFCDMITSAICIAVLLAGKEIQDRFKNRLKIPLPTELVVVALATSISHFADLNSQYNSSISGAIPTGFIPPKVPNFELIPRVAIDAIPLAVISFAFTVSLSEMFAKKNGYTVRPNQEMLAIGFCNIIPSFFHCFTTSAALAKTMVKDSTGCRTQLSSVVSAFVVLLVLLFLAPFFYSLQKCVLACIIIVSLRGALRKFRDLPRLWRLSKIDAIVWMVTMCSSALISIEIGLVIGVVFSMLCVLARTQHPKASLLGQIENTTYYEDMDDYDNLVIIPKVRIFRFLAPLYYANKDFFLKSLFKAVGLEPFLEKSRQKKMEKKAKSRNAKQINKENGDVSLSLVASAVDLHTIILDCSCISFIDTTGVNTLKGVIKEYKEVGWLNHGDGDVSDAAEWQEKNTKRIQWNQWNFSSAVTEHSAEALASSLVTDINHAIARLVDIWDSIGIMEDQRIERMQTVKKYIEVLLKNMITEEETLRHSIKTSIITTRKQLETLCLELSLEPYKVEEDLTVLQLEKNLRCRLEALQKEKSERLRELNDLMHQDEELCVTLCVTPYYIPTGSMPSQTQLQELREHIKQLSKEKESRVKVFSGLRQDIRNLMDEMGHEPETSLERESVCSDTDIFLLTRENIKALELLLSQLEMKRESLLASRNKLKDRAVSLWTRLSCPDEEAEEFKREPLNTLCDDIRRWQRVVDGLELLQRSKLEEVIDKVRQELVVFWDKCMFGPQQREPFNLHFCDVNYTEELLSLHDSELMKVKQFFEEAHPLLENIEKWERHWVLFQDFERKAADPNRFSNRGGALLKESKDRAKVQKLLPKEDLKSRVEAWEKEKGSPFLMKGQRVMEYIAKQWEEHRSQKDKEKNERMSKKADGTPFKTPSKRPHGPANSSVTPSKIRKTPNQGSLRTTTMSTSSSSSASSTFLCVPGKPPLSARSELSRKANHNAVLNSTVKDVL